MRRDKALNIFLFFLLMSMMFVYLCPVYFSVGKINMRTVSMPERFCSLLFVLLWVALCIYAAWKKRLPFLLGGIFYSIMAYLPEWLLPHLTSVAGSTKEPGLTANLFKYFFERMYELANAPLVGVSLLVSTQASQNLGKKLLPVLVLSYAGVQLFHYYRNAYLAAQLHIEDTAYSSNPVLAKELAVAPESATVMKYAENEPSTALSVRNESAGELTGNAVDSLSETESIMLPDHSPIHLPSEMNGTDAPDVLDETGQTRLRFPKIH